MSSARVETEVATHTTVVEFVHGLGGDVVVTAYGPDGEEVPYLMSVEITPDEVEVHLIPEVDTARLVAELAPPPA